MYSTYNSTKGGQLFKGIVLREIVEFSFFFIELFLSLFCLHNGNITNLPIAKCSLENQ
jgi:hypothetical protein